MAQQQPLAGGLLEPVRQSIRVRRPIEAAFELFTRDIGTWWPVETHNLGGDVAGVVFEERLGGTIYEVSRDGRTFVWGRVLAWEPPHRVVFSWHPNAADPAPTEVEVRFVAEAAAVTRVELEHRGWERLGEAGPDERLRYLNGWPYVIGRFGQSAGAA